MVELIGKIVGCTRPERNIGGVKYTEFSVEFEGNVKNFTIHGWHENLLPGRNINLTCTLAGAYSQSRNWCEYYSILDEDGNPIYTRKSDNYISSHTSP